ncbi:MAG TPA: ABC transporter permease [Vicinamibacterales bacterium]|nr:ABC transporter permease [Vicinamibacterales bacterium]
MWMRLRANVSRLCFMLARRRLDEDARLEIDAHLDLLTERYLQQGMSPDEAYVNARRQFGNVALMRQDIHEMNSLGWLEQVTRDLRYACRQLLRSPGFTVVVVATLGLGIGGATAVFSVVQAVMLAPLPYEEPAQLVRFYQQEPDRPDTRDVLSATHFTFLREQAASFADVAALAHYSETGLDLVTDGRAERLRVLRVSSGYFGTLRSQPRIGHDFTREDETGRRRVVLSDTVWRTRFGGDPSIVGTTIRLSADSYEVAGIAQPGFEDPIAPDVSAWIPYALTRDTDAENNSLTAIGRLRNGVTLERARAELVALGRPMLERWPAAKKGAIVALPLHEELVAIARGPLRLVFAAVGLVLLVACVNVANLMLVRATGRVHEFAVRAALGSNRNRLARQLLVESLLVGLLGGVAGLVLAGAGVRGLQALGRDALPRLDHIGLDAGVLTFALVVTAATAVAFGIVPALRLAGTSPIEALRQQSRSTTGTRGLARLRGTLAAAQVALAVTLVAGAGILLASFYQLQQVDVGFRVDRVLTFEVHLPGARYDAARRAAFQETLAGRLESIPGVTAAGGISRLPATGSYHPWNTYIRTGPLAGTLIDRSRFAMQQRIISGDLLAALGIPVLAGRSFDARDDASAPARAVVSANFVRAAFPGVSPEAVLGQRIAVGGLDREIVGVVGDVALDVYGAPTMVVYHAHRQFADNRNWALTQVVAAKRTPEEMLRVVREEVARLDPELVVHRPAPMAEVVDRGTSRERFALVLMGVFAVVALALAALGLYGVLAYAVRQRAPEIGIRLALGATGAEIRALVFRQAGVVVGIGVAAGLVGALMLGRWLGALAFGIAPSDPRILTISALVLALVAILAAWLPAQRAARLEPRIAMQGGD